MAGDPDTELRVLLVEDNAADARLVREMLREASPGSSLTHAARLREALEYLHARDFNIILLDLALPDSDGLQTFIRARANAPDAPIVVLTGLADEQLAARAVREGAQDYLVKGAVDGALLCRAMRYALERHQSEAALRRSEASYRTLVEGSIQGIVIHVDGIARLANRAFASLLGFADPLDLIGENLASLVLDEDLERVSELALGRPGGEQATDHYEVRVRRRDQRIIWLDCLASAIEWDGEAARLVTAIDITERKEGEASLRASEERFRQLVENIKEGFILVELPSYNLLYLSRAWGEIWGRSVDDAYRDPRLWFEAIHADDREAVTAARHTLERGTPASTTFRVMHTDGTLRWVRSRMFPVQDAHGRVYRLVGLVEDITEMRRTEEQLRHSQKMEAVGQLAGGIAHDFNNLLTAILGYSDFALEDLGADHPSARDILAIRTAGESAESLTRQLLAFSRRQVVQPRTIDVNDVIRRVDSLLRRVIGEDIELHLELAPSLPVVTVDPGQLEQVLMNLAVNARDAMPQGGRVVIATATVSFQAEDVAALRAATPGPHVALSVSDTGTGMDDAVLKRVFEPFFTTKEQGRGTGLGLATVHGIVQQWLGTIDVASQVGHGSTFTINLPAAPGDASEPWDAGADAAEQYGTETVLLVEDQPQTRDVICEALRRRGYTVIQATDGAEAIERAEQLQGALHLLLTDVVMPGINGRQLAERIQSVAPSVRVIYMSGYTDDTILQHGVLDPRLAFIQKPFTSNVVLAKVREVLSAPEPPPLL